MPSVFSVGRARRARRPPSRSRDALRDGVLDRLPIAAGGTDRITIALNFWTIALLIAAWICASVAARSRSARSRPQPLRPPASPCRPSRRLVVDRRDELDLLALQSRTDPDRQARSLERHGLHDRLGELVASATLAPESCFEAWAETPLARTTAAAANMTAATLVLPSLLLCTAFSFRGGNCCSMRRDTRGNLRGDAHAAPATRSGKLGTTCRPNMRIWSSISSTVFPTKIRPQRWLTPASSSCSTCREMSSGVPSRFAVM